MTDHRTVFARGLHVACWKQAWPDRPAQSAGHGVMTGCLTGFEAADRPWGPDPPEMARICTPDMFGPTWANLGRAVACHEPCRRIRPSGVRQNSTCNRAPCRSCAARRNRSAYRAWAARRTIVLCGAGAARVAGMASPSTTWTAVRETNTNNIILHHLQLCPLPPTRTTPPSRNAAWITPWT